MATNWNFFLKEQLHQKLRKREDSQSARVIVVSLNALIFHLITSDIAHTLFAWMAIYSLDPQNSEHSSSNFYIGKH